MKELHGMHDLMKNRIRFAAAVGLSTCILLSFESNVARASWFTRFKYGKTADVDARTNQGLSGSIRKLMKEAREQESLGNLDKAITLAERAAALSEKSSKILSNADDVSPAVTSRLVNELRLKKAESSIPRSVEDSTVSHPATEKRTRAKPSAALVKQDSVQKDSAQKDSAQKDSKTDDLPRAKPNKFDSSDRLSQPKGAVVAIGKIQPSGSGTSESVASLKVQQSSGTRSQTVLNRPSEKLVEAAPVVTFAPSRERPKPVPPSTLQADSSVKDLSPSETAKTSQPQSDSKSTVAQKVDDCTSDVSKSVEQSATTPKEKRSEKSQVESRTAIATAKRLKLRAQFVLGDATEDAWLVASPLSDVVYNHESTRGMMHVSPISHETDGATDDESWQYSQSDNEFDQGRGEAATSVAGIARFSGTESVKSTDNWDEDSEDDFPIDRVLDLKRRLDSASALQPGDLKKVISAYLLDESNREDQIDDEEEFAISPLMDRRSEKRHHSFEKVTSVTPIPTQSTPETRSPMFGRTFLIQWRSAKVDSSVPAVAKRNDNSKPVRLPEDLRQVFREPSESTRDFMPKVEDAPDFSLPKLDLGVSIGAASDRSIDRTTLLTHRERSDTLPQLQGSLWDHASAPVTENDYNFNPESLKPGELLTDRTAEAPLPPPEEPAGTVSFDSPLDLFARHNRMRPEAASLNDESSDTLMGSRVSHLPQGRFGDVVINSRRTNSIEPVVASSPLERLAMLFGLPVSSGPAILGAMSVAMLILGLWMVRPQTEAQN